MQDIKTIELKKIDKESLLKLLSEQIIKIENAPNFEYLIQETQISYEKIHEFILQYQIVQFRFYGDTSQSDLKELFDYYQSSIPEVEVEINHLDKVLAKSPFLEDLKEFAGENFYYKLIHSNYDYTTRAKELMALENKLTTEITEFKSQSKILWNEEEIPLSSIYKYIRSNDRNIRKQAHDALSSYYTKHRLYFYQQLIKLIELRNEFARELGFESYVEYSLKKWNRIGYDYTHLDTYRELVIQYFKKTYELIYDFKKKTLKHVPTYYDNNLFEDGFPQLTVKNETHTINTFRNILEKINQPWAALFQNMIEHQTIDYIDRPNKVNMGYATYLTNMDTPLIYSQFQNNDTDVRVISHEFGHTLQFLTTYKGASNKYFIESNLDTVEIFSHSMEMLSLDHMNLLFGEDATKYQISNYNGHLVQVLTCALGDEFQEKIYKLKDPSVDSIQGIYRELQEKYTGNLFDSSENDFFIRGDRWMEIDHYFNSPFYLVDYSLAIINALNIYRIYSVNKQSGIDLWESLAKNIGKLNYGNIKEILPNLGSPFEEQFVQETAEFSMKKFEEMLNTYPTC